MFGQEFLALCIECTVILTDCDEAGEEDIERLSVSDGFGQRVYQDRDVAARVVHEEQEDAEDGGLDGGGDDLHQDDEQDPEPGLGF